MKENILEAITQHLKQTNKKKTLETERRKEHSQNEVTSDHPCLR